MPKTLTIKDLLKKELLIVELPENKWLSIFPRLILICDREKNEYHHIKGSYTILGSPDEMKEEDAMGLVEETEMGVKLNSKKYKYRAYNSQLGYATATESLLSALESEITESFDFKRTLIFVKN